MRSYGIANNLRSDPKDKSALERDAFDMKFSIVPAETAEAASGCYSAATALDVSLSSAPVIICRYFASAGRPCASPRDFGA